MIHLMLKNLRLNSSLTQKQVASALGVERSTYTCYETGKSQPTLDTLLKLSKIFNVSLDDLIFESSTRIKNVQRLQEQELDYNSSVSPFSGLNSEEKSLLAFYRSMSDNSKSKFLKVAEDLIKEEN